MLDKDPLRRIDPRAAATQPKIKWDDSAMKSSYANVCNVLSSREEVTLLFGTHQSVQSGQEEVTVKLSDRLILSPFAAKRLAALLVGVLGEYEKRFGAIVIDRKQEPREVH